MGEVLFFFIILLVVSIFSAVIGRFPVSFQMIFILSGMFIGWLVTGYVDVTQPPYSSIIFLIAEIALVLVLFTDASRIGLKALKNNLSNRLLIIGLPHNHSIRCCCCNRNVSKHSMVGWWSYRSSPCTYRCCFGTDSCSEHQGTRKDQENHRNRNGLNDGGAVPFLLVFIAIGLASEVFRPMGYFVEVAIEQILFGVIVWLNCWVIRWLDGFKGPRKKMDHT